MSTSAPSWERIAGEQHGVVSRGQLLASGLTRAQASRHLMNGRWRTLAPGVYVVHRGPVSDEAAAWAALLYAGPGAALSHGTALWLDGVLDTPPAAVHVTIPGERRVVSRRGMLVHRSKALPFRIHPSRTPSRTRLDESVLDQLEFADAAGVIDLVMRSTQRRLTTAARLRGALAARARHPHRSLILDVTADVDVGTQSALEGRYLHDVERAHGLPRGARNQPERSDSVTRYHDVRYRKWCTVVELDGRIAHPVETAFRDLRRDNRLVLGGDAVLRFGWVDVVTRPCAAAAQVAALLRMRGWTGTPTRCGAMCAVLAVP